MSPSPRSPSTARTPSAASIEDYNRRSSRTVCRSRDAEHPQGTNLMTRLCLAAVGLLMAVCLAAAPAAAGKKDDTLVWATDRDNPIADPFYLNTRELVVIGHHVWDTLVIIDPKTAEIKPLLATKWKWVDATTLEFELRKGVKFHSGREMDADDVVYTFNHASNSD